MDDINFNYIFLISPMYYKYYFSTCPTNHISTAQESHVGSVYCTESAES